MTHPAPAQRRPISIQVKVIGVLVGLMILAKVFGVSENTTPAVPADTGLSDGHYIRDAENNMRARMKDPDAVHFQNETVVRSGADVTVCGQLNAKNSFGAYTGFAPFLVKNGTPVLPEDLAQLGKNAVRDMFAVCR